MNIWILEDDFRIADLHQQYVEAQGTHEVTGNFRYGAELITTLSTAPHPDVLLADLYVPDVTAYELVDTVRKTAPHIDIVIISAAAETTHVTALYDRGVKDYLLKPFQAERLHASLAHLAQQRTLLSNAYVTQQQLDQLFHIGASKHEQTMPKGIDAQTLETIKMAFLSHEMNHVTAAALSEQFGISRSTARRYLEHLVAENVLMTTLLYGTVGRPERQYVLRETYEQNDI